MTYPYRYDYLKLSTESSPDASKVADGSTLYEADTGTLYLAYKGTWYEQTFKDEESEEE